MVGARVRRRLSHALVRVKQLLERRGMTAVASERLLPAYLRAVAYRMLG
jgi:hypothetical protein